MLQFAKIPYILRSYNLTLINLRKKRLTAKVTAVCMNIRLICQMRDCFSMWKLELDQSSIVCLKTYAVTSGRPIFRIPDINQSYTFQQQLPEFLASLEFSLDKANINNIKLSRLIDKRLTAFWGHMNMPWWEINPTDFNSRI